MAQGELILSVSYVGDLVTAVGVLPLLGPGGPGRRLAAAPAAAPLLADDPRVPEVRVVRSAHPLGWRLEALALLLQARRAGAPVVNLEVYLPRWRFAVRCCRLLRLPARHLDLPGLLGDNQRSALGQPTRLAHRSDHYAVAVGGSAPAPPPTLPVDPVFAARAGARLAGDRGGRFVVVHPGSSDPARRAPLDLLARVSAEAAGAGCRPVLVGTAAETSVVGRLRERLPRGLEAIDACGQLGIRDLAALTSQAALFVGGDSGPLKIAEAVGARTLSFWHAGQPSAAFAGPRGPGHALLPATASADEALAAARRLLSR